jgi:hypothetical protein
MSVKKKLIHVAVREDLYLKLWEIIKRKYQIPHKKLNVAVNEALEDYVNKHRGLLEVKQ